MRRWLCFCLGLCLGLQAWWASAADTIVLWHAYRAEERQVLGDLLREFERQRPGLRIETLAVPYDAYGTKLASAIPIGEGPDLFIDAHERLGDYRARGLLGPVGDALGDAAHFSQVGLEAVSLGDESEAARAFGVPLSLKCVALYFNKSLVAAPPRHFEDLAGTLRAPLGKNSWLLAYETRNLYFHAAFFGAFGGRLLRPGDRFGFVGQAAERSLGFVQGLMAKGWVPEGADGAMVTRLFLSGKAAYAIGGPWLAAELKKASFEFGVVALPELRASQARMRPLLTVESVMLSAPGARRPAVRRLAAFLASARAAGLRRRRLGTVSARNDLPPPQDPFVAGFAAAARLAQPMSSRVAMRAVWEPGQRAMRKVFSGTMSATKALEQAQRRYRDVRRPLPKKRSPTFALILSGLFLLAGAWLLLRRARDPVFVQRLQQSRQAYRYLVHAVVVVGVLVFIPLLAGAFISLYAGQPGKQHYVGAANFVSILSARGGPLLTSGSFYFVLLVTLLWTLCNLALHLTLGLSLGALLSRPKLAFRGVYRVLLIVPWAVPNYVTALAWKGMFHRQFGAVTALTNRVGAWLGLQLEPVDWFARFSTAFAANVATNVWLGFPFMMVVTIAAMTAVPASVLEAAEIDGATRWQRFRRVTLPMIRPSLLPAVLLGAMWTFNMFNVVFLVSGGAPDGQTDILVSEAYRWAFTRQARYGYAAAYSVLIFLLLFGATRLPDLLRGLAKKRGVAT